MKTRGFYRPSLSSRVCVQAAGDLLVQALVDVASLRRQRRGYRVQLVELLREAFELCDEDGSGEVDPEECINLDKEIAAVSGREFDAEGTKKVRIGFLSGFACRISMLGSTGSNLIANGVCRKRCVSVQAFDTMDANGDGMVSFYEYTTLQLQLIQPEDYGKTVESLTRLLPQVAVYRQAKKERLAKERRVAKEAKARAFNYRLERILSAHGGAAAVVVGRDSLATSLELSDDNSIASNGQISNDGARTAVRSWNSHGVDQESGSRPEHTSKYGARRSDNLHWSGEQQQIRRVRSGRKGTLQQLAGTHLCCLWPLAR